MVVYSLKHLARSRIDAMAAADRLEERMHTITAAKLAVTAGANADRIGSEAAFAHLCGAAPIPASSGKTNRHRLNHGGDRRGNSALHRIAIVRLKHDPATRAYAARRKADGKSTKEILRCLKRAIAREVFHVLTDHTPDAEPVDLRAIRQQRNFTLADAAEALDTWPSRISDIERGRRPLPALRARYRQWLTAA